MRTLCAIAVAVVALAANHGPSQEKKKDPPPAKKDDPKKAARAKLMADKLKHAQKLLDGLATEDFDKIGAASDDLMTASKTAEFLARKTREYERHTLDFRRSLDTITKKAKAKNIDGAALGYVDLTLTCIRCHQHTREAADALAPVPLWEGFGRAE